MNATSRHHTSIVSLLLRAQASLDHTTQHGNTCLHLAADKGMDEICKMLLEAGAPVNVRNVVSQLSERHIHAYNRHISHHFIFYLSHHMLFCIIDPALPHFRCMISRCDAWC